MSFEVIATLRPRNQYVLKRDLYEHDRRRIERLARRGYALFLDSEKVVHVVKGPFSLDDRAVMRNIGLKEIKELPKHPNHGL
jgi:hypothetical protein